MNQFLRHAGEFLRTYPQVRLSSKDEGQIRDECMKHLGLNNLGQLRDRYEGQAFFDKTLMNLGSVLTIQKHFKLPLIDVTKTDLGGFKPKISLNGKVMDILVFQFGTLPLVNIDELNNPVFFVIQKDRVTFNLCGIGTREIIENNLIETSVEKSTYTNYMNFTGFKFLLSSEKYSG